MSIFSLASELAPFKHCVGSYWLEAGLGADGKPSVVIHITVLGYMPRGEVIAMQMNCAAAVKQQCIDAGRHLPQLAGLTQDEINVSTVVHYA